jgi:hypothetical protein
MSTDFLFSDTYEITQFQSSIHQHFFQCDDRRQDTVLAHDSYSFIIKIVTPLAQIYGFQKSKSAFGDPWNNHTQPASSSNWSSSNGSDLEPAQKRTFKLIGRCH